MTSARGHDRREPDGKIIQHRKQRRKRRGDTMTPRKVEPSPVDGMTAEQAFEAYRDHGWPVRLDPLGVVQLRCGEGVVAVVRNGDTSGAWEKLCGTHGQLPDGCPSPSADGAFVRIMRAPRGVRSAMNLHGVAEGVHVFGLGREIALPPSVPWRPRCAPVSLDFASIPVCPPWILEAAADPLASRRAWQATLSPRTCLPCTDTGNAERLVRRHGADLRYCPSWGTWLVWDGSRWARDEEGEVTLRAIDTVRAIETEESKKEQHEDTRKDLIKHAWKSESRASLSSMVDLAKVQPGIPVAPDKLDSDPWELCCENGTVDLQSGALRPHSRSDLCTKRARVCYDPDARAPLFDTFLEIVQPDPEVRGYLQRLLGYSLTGVIREHVLPIHYGTGSNGKGTLTDLILHVLGDYAGQIPTELLLAKSQDAHPAERCTLLGLRFAAASETDEGRSISAALVKQLTGGDAIAARFMRQNFFTFLPTHKLWLSTNHKPVMTDTTHAMWRRVTLVPWQVTIPNDRQDTGLPQRLREEAPGVLAWLVRGCLEWQTRGLDPPACVLVATQEYRGESDWLGEFLAARCSTLPECGTGAAPTAFAKQLWESYRTWCVDAGCEVRTQTAFGRALRERGFERTKNGVISWKGVRLLSVGGCEQEWVQ